MQLQKCIKFTCTQCSARNKPSLLGWICMCSVFLFLCRNLSLTLFEGGVRIRKKMKEWVNSELKVWAGLSWEGDWTRNDWGCGSDAFSLLPKVRWAQSCRSVSCTLNLRKRTQQVSCASFLPVLLSQISSYHCYACRQLAFSVWKPALGAAACVW